MDAGPFEAEVGSFWLHLAAEGKADRTLDASGELSALRRACQGRSFRARRDAAMIEVLLASGIRLSELAGIRHDPSDPSRSDLRLLDRYVRARARHPQAARPQLWLGAAGRGPLTPNGVYQAVARVGERAGVAVYPHRFRHHFSHTWLEHGGAEGDLMELNGWVSPQMLTRYGASARGARARRSYDRVMSAP
jgi:integrase/recombinase XerD